MKEVYPISQLCLALGVSRNGFYAWKNHRPSRRAQEDTQLGAKIVVAHARSRRTYGSPRVASSPKVDPGAMRDWRRESDAELSP